MKYAQSGISKRVMEQDEWIRAIVALYHVTQQTAQEMFKTRLISGELVEVND